MSSHRLDEGSLLPVLKSVSTCAIQSHSEPRNPYPNVLPTSFDQIVCPPPSLLVIIVIVQNSLRGNLSSSPTMLFKAFILALSLSLNSPVSAGPAITPPAAAALAARAAQFTGVSITPVSIKPVSIEPVTIATPTISSFSQSRTRYGPTPTCTQTIKPDKNGYVPPDTCDALYHYYPSFGAAVLFSVLFGMTMVAHFAQAVMYKKKFCWVICMGATWDFIALAARSASTREQQSTSILLIAQLFVLLAPLCMYLPRWCGPDRPVRLTGIASLQGLTHFATWSSAG